jgi:hypothetical protein
MAEFRTRIMETWVFSSDGTLVMFLFGLVQHGEVSSVHNNGNQTNSRMDNLAFFLSPPCSAPSLTNICSARLQLRVHLAYIGFPIANDAKYPFPANGSGPGGAGEAEPSGADKLARFEGVGTGQWELGPVMSLVLAVVDVQ